MTPVTDPVDIVTTSSSENAPRSADARQPQPGARRFRVLYVEGNEDGSVGGSHEVLYNMLLALDTSRYEPLVLFYQDNPYAGALRSAGVRCVLWDSVRAEERAVHTRGSKFHKALEVGRAILRRTALLRNEAIDLVHLNNSPHAGNDDWLPAARLARLPIVVSARGDAAPIPGKSLGAVVRRRLIRHFDRVAAISEYMADAMRTQGIPADRVQVVHDGLDVSRHAEMVFEGRDVVRHSVGVPDGRLLVTMVGNVRWWKGQHVVIQALTLLPGDVLQRIHVVFVGAVTPEYQTYYDDLLSAIRSAGLAGSVTFLGYRDNVAEILSASDIAVHASVIPEPAGLVILEAMLNGAAVIVANAGGTRDYVTAQTGLTHDAQRPEELASRLETLVMDAQLRRRISEAARERAAAFSVSTTARRMEALYAELLIP